MHITYSFQFYSVSKLDVSKWNVSNISNLQFMFNAANKLLELDISNWDTSNVTNMNDMFRHCESLKQITGILDMSKVTSYSAMFEYTYDLESVNIKLPSNITQSSFISTSKITNSSAVNFV